MILVWLGAKLLWRLHVARIVGRDNARWQDRVTAYFLEFFANLVVYRSMNFRFLAPSLLSCALAASAVAEQKDVWYRADGTPLTERPADGKDAEIDLDKRIDSEVRQNSELGLSVSGLDRQRRSFFRSRGRYRPIYGRWSYRPRYFYQRHGRLELRTPLYDRSCFY